MPQSSLYKKLKKILFFFFLVSQFINFANAQSLVARKCPYSCALLGLDPSECNDYRVGNRCFVQRLPSTKPALSGNIICLEASSGRLRIRNKCQDGESEVSVQSLKGETGPEGPKGSTGETGSPGINGINGSNGSNGTPGSNGSNGANGTNGSNGANGTDGMDGTLRVYGDGSAGDEVISANSIYDFDNSQFDDFTVMPGVTLTVPSGTVIHCTGNFFNQGTINVLSSLRQHPKISENGQAALGFKSGGTQATGGSGGSALPQGAAKQIVHPGFLSGGDGYKKDSEAGSSGGGNFVVICQGAISNLAGGIISADGLDGGQLGRGGGGGGIVVLASKTSVLNQGTITAVGGAGALLDPDDGSNGYGPGGGGGGGIIQMIAPSVSNSGTFNVAGGIGGTAGGAGSITAMFYIGGGGGGASGGDGGNGGNVNPGNIGNNSTSAGQNGTLGKTFLITADPTSLY
jgi:hypothetical protein